MSDRDKYILGGGYRRRRRSTRSRKPITTVDELLVDILGASPTRFVELASGQVMVENPNVCGICHKGRHRDTAHHAFEADRAFPNQAAALGWPLPPPEALL